ncbi:MAG: ThiF family adenylyltransferase [Brevinematales bacterium]|nr:ThiF family adenylyltransferase [Brevinematales bacterium]
MAKVFLTPARFRAICGMAGGSMEFRRLGDSYIPDTPYLRESGHNLPAERIELRFADTVEYSLRAAEEDTGRPVWNVLLGDTLLSLFGHGDTRDIFPALAEASRFSGARVDTLAMADGGSYYSAPLERTIAGHGDAHHRTLLWLGARNFDTLRGARLGLIGAGGLGFPFALSAVRHGFAKFTIADPDIIEESNRNRLYGTLPGDTGKPKADVLKRELESFGAGIDVVAHMKAFSAELYESFAECDILIAGVDNDYARVSAQLFALLARKPLFDMGSGIFLDDNLAAEPSPSEMGGQVRAALPDGPCLGCMGLDPASAEDDIARGRGIERGYIIGTDVTPPAVVTLNSIVASACLSMTVDYLTRPGGLAVRHLCYDQLGYRFRAVAEEREKHCPICSI